jgi:hypothetical protein
LMHEGKWRVIGDANGPLTFFRPDGRKIRAGPPPLRPDVKNRINRLLE